MKLSILATAILIVSLTSCTKSAVDNNANTTPSITVVDASVVPSAARTALATNFPGATEVEWHKSSGSTIFSAQFNQAGQRHEAGFDDSGHQSSHSVICLSNPVPQVVLDAFRQRYPGDNVFEWKLTADGSWKAHIMRGTTKYEATFSASGVFIKFEQA